jgi:PleD family two-component response regulator
LVADRNPRFLDKTQEILAEAGYDMVGAQSGDQVREALRSGPLDGALLHVALPGTSGFALCREMKERDPALPVVLMFSLEDEAGMEEARRAGAENYLVRPLKKTEVLFVARAMLAERSMLMRGARMMEERDAARREGGTNVDGGRLLQFELFKRILHIELKRSRRYGFPLSLLVATLDEPARPSDRDGLASSVRSAIRDIDIPVAFGATDVLVVMPHTDLEGARLVAERICKRVRATGGRTPFTA